MDCTYHKRGVVDDNILDFHLDSFHRTGVAAAGCPSDATDTAPRTPALILQPWAAVGAAQAPASSGGQHITSHTAAVTFEADITLSSSDFELVDTTAVGHVITGETVVASAVGGQPTVRSSWKTGVTVKRSLEGAGGLAAALWRNGADGLLPTSLCRNIEIQGWV
jgi:hypothetical protein